MKNNGLNPHFYETMVMHSPNAIIVCHHDYQILKLNSAAENLMSVANADVMNRPIEVCFSEDGLIEYLDSHSQSRKSFYLLNHKLVSITQQKNDEMVVQCH